MPKTILNRPLIDVIIPAYNEEGSITKVIEEIPNIVRTIIVCNNGSKDQTKARARSAGAVVVDEPRSGYGSACLAGIEYLKDAGNPPDIVVFIDGDYSDYPEQLIDIVRPIQEGYDMVIGSRALGKIQQGSMTTPQIFGNWLATNLIRLFYKYEFTDLGPFRGIRYDRLLELDMQDRDFGWTVEMQVKAAKQGLKCTEVPVDYKKESAFLKYQERFEGQYYPDIKYYGPYLS